MCTSFKHSGQVELCMHFVQINLTFALNMIVPWPWCRPAASWNWLKMLSPKSVAEAWGRIWRLCFWAKAIINGMLSISSCTCPGIWSNPQIWSVVFCQVLLYKHANFLPSNLMSCMCLAVADLCAHFLAEGFYTLRDEKDVWTRNSNDTRLSEQSRISAVFWPYETSAFLLVTVTQCYSTNYHQLPQTPQSSVHTTWQIMWKWGCLASCTVDIPAPTYWNISIEEGQLQILLGVGWFLLCDKAAF